MEDENQAVLSLPVSIPEQSQMVFFYPYRTLSRNCDYRDSGGDAASGAEQGAGSSSEHLLRQSPQTAGNLFRILFRRQ